MDDFWLGLARHTLMRQDWVDLMNPVYLTLKSTHHRLQFRFRLLERRTVCLWLHLFPEQLPALPPFALPSALQRVLCIFGVDNACG